MMKTPFLFMVCALAACGRGNDTGGVIVFDNRADYPASELTLADIADVEYIKIGKSDDFLMAGNVDAKGEETYVGKEFIIKKDNDRLFVFDRQGTPIRKIGNTGRGPAEYSWLQYFVGVDETLDEVYIYGGYQRLLVYGLDGEFRRGIDTETPRFLGGMKLLNDEEIICMDQMDDGGFYTISRQDGKFLRKLPVTFALPYKHDPHGRMAYPNIFHTGNGTTLFDLRTDTIHRITPGGELVPAIVDVTKYPSPDELYGPDNAQFLPLFETGQYIIGSILCSPWITPNVKEKYYIYDKRERQWFTLKGEGMSFNGFAAITGQINIPRSARTQNPGYAALFLQPVSLLENRDKWRSAELDRVLEGVAEDDNPILMLIKFK
jgi:hypothetical protein